MMMIIVIIIVGIYCAFKSWQVPDSRLSLPHDNDLAMLNVTLKWIFSSFVYKSKELSALLWLSTDV